SSDLVARDTLTWVGSEAARGAELRETGVQRRMLEAMERAGLWTNDGPIVAFGPTSAMPHYEPHAGADRRLAEGDVVLLDLWAGPGQGSVFAAQTWMGFAGRSPDADVRRVRSEERRVGKECGGRGRGGQGRAR